MVRTVGIRFLSRGLFELAWSFSGSTTLRATCAVPPGVTPSFSRSVVTIARGGRPCAAPTAAAESSASRQTGQDVNVDRAVCITDLSGPATRTPATVDSQPPSSIRPSLSAAGLAVYFGPGPLVSHRSGSLGEVLLELVHWCHRPLPAPAQLSASSSRVHVLMHSILSPVTG